MEPLKSLRAPLLLLAMPQVQDPFFFKSVVLLAAHEDEGSFGFVVNRPTELTVRQVLEGLSIDWRGNPSTPTYMGGPVQPHVGTVLFPSSSRPRSDDGSSEVAPGVGITQNLKSLASLALEPPVELRLLLGYAGWSPGQLVLEVARHDWLLAPVEPDLVFVPNPAETWARALSRVGIDSASLPNLSFEPEQVN